LVIEHDGVKAARRKSREPLFAGGRLFDRVAGRFERQPHHLPDVRFIVDDENRHGCTSSVMGIVKVNVEPLPGSDCTLSWPPWASMMRREIVRPRPAPPGGASG